MAGPKSGPRTAQAAPASQASAAPKEERPVLFQHYFKSGPRTYAAQVKQASNGRPFLVLTEGRRDPETDEVHKSRILVFNDDLTAFFHLLQETAAFLRPLRGAKSAVPAGAAPVTSPDPFSSSQPAPLPTRAAAVAPASPANTDTPLRSSSQRPGGKLQPPVTRVVQAAIKPQSRPTPARPTSVRPSPAPAAATRKQPSYSRSVAAQPAKAGRR